MNSEKKPFFSILMANFDKGDYIACAIGSVLAQTFHDWELIICDDASSDNSWDVISGYLPDKRLTAFRRESNKGYICALETMISKSSGDVLAVLDSDDALHPQALEKIFKAYSKNPDIGMAYTQCYYCDRGLKPAHLGFSGRIEQSNLHENKINAMRTFKKRVFMKTGGYDHRCAGAEDIDLNLKLEEISKLYFIDEPLYYYRILDNSETHGFIRTRINRSSAALAKLNAFKRRRKSSVPNLKAHEVSEVIFWGLINSVLAFRWELFLYLLRNLLVIQPWFFLDPRFYRSVAGKIMKICELKAQKPLLKI